MPHFVTRHGEPLVGNVSLETLIAATPTTSRTKGIFFSDLVKMLPPRRWEEIVLTLDVVPRLDRYVPFTAYPVRDLLRLVDAAARERFAAVPTREGYRRLGHFGFKAFCDTTVGRVIMAVLGDPMAAAKKYPEAYAMMTNAAAVTSEECGPRHARLTFARYVGACEYDVGVCEAAVAHFGSASTIGVDHGPDAMVLDVRW